MFQYVEKGLGAMMVIFAGLIAFDQVQVIANAMLAFWPQMG